MKEFINGFKSGYAEAKAKYEGLDPKDRVIRKVLKRLTAVAVILTLINLRLALNCGFWVFL